MASSYVVYLDPEGMEVAWAKAQQMKEKESFCMQRLAQLLTDLREAYTSISEETQYFGHNINADSVKKQLNAQMAALEEIADDLTAAMEKANWGNSNLKTECEQIGLQLAAIGSIAANFDPTAAVVPMTAPATKAMTASLALSGVMGVSFSGAWVDLSNWLKTYFERYITGALHGVQQTWNAIQTGMNHVLELDPDVKISKIKNEVAQRSKYILETEDDKLPYVSTNSRYNNSEGQINCRWLARQKLQSIIGEPDLFDGMVGTGSLGKNFEKYEKTGINGYSIDYVDTSDSTSMASLKESLLEKQPCSVLFYMNGHEVTVDRIEGDMVYFSDNFDQGAGYETGVSDATSLYETTSSGKYVPTVRTGQAVCVSFDAFADYYDTYARKNVLSYVVVKKEGE